MRASGRDARFAAAVAQYGDALYRVCCAYVPDDADRQDLYQEVLIRIWRNLESFRGESRLSTWMYRVAVNTCLGWLRQEHRRSQLLARATEEQRHAATRQPPRHDRPVAADVQRLYETIARLSPVDRLLVSLYLEEMSTAEMASVLGISDGNVRVKLHRVKVRLRQMWETDGHES